MAIFLMLMGLLFCALNARDEYRGMTSVESPTVSPSMPDAYHKQQDRKAFRNAMNYNWFWSGSLLAIGCLMLAWIRRSNRLDPLLPDFRGDVDLD